MHLRSKTVQQLLSVILSAVMVLSMLPMEVLAQETPPVTTPMDLTAITEDTSGDGWSWTQSTKTLTLTGLTLTVSDDSAHALILPDGATIDLADGTASTLTGGSRSTVYSSGEVKLDEVSIAEQGLLVQGALQVEVLYITSDDSHPFLCRKEALPFEQLIEVPGMTKDSVWYLDSALDQLAVDMVSGTELEVKAVVILSVLVLARERAAHVASVTEAPLDTESLKALPAFVLYVAQPGDTLWDIAREYHSTEKRICEINGCALEDVHPGQKLILIKEV